MLKAVYFDEERHLYTDDARRRVPGVTDVLRSTVATATWYRGDSARLLGQFIHDTTEYDDRGTLDHSGLPDHLWDRLIAWRKFKKDFQVEILDIERIVWHPRLRFAGKLDRRARVCGKTAVIDIKGGVYEEWFKLQTAAYALALEGLGEPVDTRFTVRLLANGLYEQHEYPSMAKDAAGFVACLGVYNWMKENG